MVNAYLGLGANLGDRAAQIAQACTLLGQSPEIDVVRVSSLYETVPVGVTEQPLSLNAVAKVRTTLEPDQLLQVALHIENLMGRVRNQHWGPRVIDIDVLLYGDRQIETPTLRVPHPYLLDRAFALIPLAEIAPDVLLPGLKCSVKDFLQSGNISLSGVVCWNNTPGVSAENRK